jgi:lysophospholipase L1-like esterase
MKRLIPLISFLFFIITGSYSQVPFADEITAFKKADGKNFPPKNAILFVGSSSFRKWQDVQEYFPGYTIINRGFGGSSLPDVIHFANDIIFPYHPKQIVLYCGENDFAASDTVSVNTVYNRFLQLFSIIRRQMPVVPIVFVSIKPSPGRKHLFQKFLEANLLIRSFLKKQPYTVYADVYYKMLNPDGTPKKEIFTEDNLHMNNKGYGIWKEVLLPSLIK